MIILHDVSKIYGEDSGAIRALDKLSLSVDKGEHAAIIGPSGSGKSTLLNIIGLLDVPDSGSYRLAGNDVLALPDKTLSRLRNRTFGFVFQSFNLLPRMSAADNVAMPLRYTDIPAREHRDRAMEMLRVVGLADRARHSPAQLSGGQQQRVSIARALINAPEVILADEPTGNLDSASAHEIMDVLEGLRADGLTLLLITHSHEIANRAQRVIHLRDGRCADEAA